VQSTTQEETDIGKGRGGLNKKTRSLKEYSSKVKMGFGLCRTGRNATEGEGRSYGICRKKKNIHTIGGRTAGSGRKTEN